MKMIEDLLRDTKKHDEVKKIFERIQKFCEFLIKNIDSPKMLSKDFYKDFCSQKYFFRAGNITSDRLKDY